MEKITKINQIPFKILLFLVLNDLLDTSAQLLMNITSYFHHLFNFANPDILFFWVGLMIYLSNFFLWMKILSKIDLSVALPLASIGYILIPAAAIFFLHEHILPMRWMGLALIMLGIYFVSQSQPSEAKP